MAQLRDWLAQLRGGASRRDRGQGLMEYGLIISVVSIAAVVLIMAMGPRVASMFSGAGASLSSDRRRKGNFAAVNCQEVLTRVAALPIATWHYLSEGPATRHVGPMAQEFHAAFGVGADDTQIALVDASGVALAAIQGLHGQVLDHQSRLALIETRLAAQEPDARRSSYAREAVLAR
jgi:Flp pilus assembly pilin Flp